MNIFWLDKDPELSARYACDQHIVKMLTEHTQQLCTVAHALGLPAPMRSTHSNHPCIVWLKSDFANFVYLTQLNYMYYVEYLKRYKRGGHKGYLQMLELLEPGWPAFRSAYQQMGADQHRKVKVANIVKAPHLYITLPPQAIKPEFKTNARTLAGVIRAYRQAYKFDKSRFARYAHSDKPAFLR